MGLEDVHLHAICRVSGLVLPPACAVGGTRLYLFFWILYSSVGSAEFFQENFQTVPKTVLAVVLVCYSTSTSRFRGKIQVPRIYYSTTVHLVQYQCTILY
eukprot:SAG11_NODE_90_length_17153_cov_63.471033_3_plen_100_part_00